MCTMEICEEAKFTEFPAGCTRGKKNSNGKKCRSGFFCLVFSKTGKKFYIIFIFISLFITLLFLQIHN